MAMVVKNNMSAVSTLNTLNKNSSALQKSLSKVSSGMKINTAQDDASGYAISERMRVQIRSLDQANQNTQNGSSMMKTAEGAVSSTVEILKSLKEKAINAANDTNKDADRTTIQKEIDQFIDQIDDNALVTFNGKYLVDGSKSQQGKATKTAMTNQSLAENTVGSTKLTNLKNRNNESLEIDSTDFVTASFVKDGKTYTTKFQVGASSDLETIFTNMNKIKDENGKSVAPFGAAQTNTSGSMTLEEAKKIVEVVGSSSTVSAAGMTDAAKNLNWIASGNNTELKDKNGNAITAESFSQAIQTLTEAGENGKAETSIEAILRNFGSVSGKEVGEARVDLEDEIGRTMGYSSTITLSNTDLNPGTATGVASVGIESTKYDENGNTSTGVVYTIDGAFKDAAVGERSSSTSIATTGTAIISNTSLQNIEAARAEYIDNVMTSIDNVAELHAKGVASSVALSTVASSATTLSVSSNTSVYTDIEYDTANSSNIGSFADLGPASSATSASPSLGANTAVATDSTTVKDYDLAYAFDKVYGGAQVLGNTANIGITAAGNLQKTADGTNGLTITAGESGVGGQISGVTISITDSEGNVKKAANASLDAFSTTIYAKNKSDANELSFQVGASANQAIAVGLEDMRSEALGLKGRDGSKVSVATQDKANAAVNVFDNAIQKALDQQTTIGAIEARLEYTSQNLTTSSENVQAAESTIRDADMAKEMTNYTKNNVLLQAAQSMLAQANQSSSAVLSLLQ